MIILTAIMITMTVTMIGLDYFMTIIYGIGTFFVGFKVTKISIYEYHLTI